MPRKRGKVPSYCQHKASGHAAVRLDGVDHYLGPYGSPSSQDAYQRLVAEWLVRKKEGATPPPKCRDGASADLTLAQVIFRYRAFAKTYYVKDGRPTKELTDMRYALQPVRRLYWEQSCEMVVSSD